jgi:hypothetical protein
VVTLYRRSGGRTLGGGKEAQAMPVVDWVAVQHDNPSSRITF